MALGMTCGEAMERNFDVCVAHERLLDALEIMSATQQDSVPVVASRESMLFEGFISAAAAALHLGLTDRRPSEVMCREVVAPAAAQVGPEEDANHAAELMKARHLQLVPVVAAGKLVGLLPASRLGRAT